MPFISLRTSLVRNFELAVRLAQRDIASKYKNSLLGALWMIGQPLLQLLLYGFVFQIVLRAKWGLQLPNGNDVPFGLALFVGILLHGLLADTLVRAPSLIVSNTSYVKKIIFPIEILPVANVMSGLATVFFGTVLLLVGTLFFTGTLHVVSVLLLIPVASLALMTVGIGWLLSSIGVYFRDLSQLTSNLSTVMLFTAPICYPAEIVPKEFRWLLSVNPLTIPVEAAREMLFSGKLDSVIPLALYSLASILIAILGLVVFNRVRDGFADVL
jgi:lipopolysaccharide transport system permease protein